ILKSGMLRPDFMGALIGHYEQLQCSPALLYVRGWKAGIGSRKPRPGFMPDLYAARRMDSDSLEDPFAHYIRHGCPEGPWQQPVIFPGDRAPKRFGHAPKVALHIHAYYPEMLDELLDRMGRNRTRPDLYISVKDESSKRRAAMRLEQYPGKVAAIEVVPNQGRDIGPFLSTFGPTLVQKYDLIGHVH